MNLFSASQGQCCCSHRAQKPHNGELGDWVQLKQWDNGNQLFQAPTPQNPDAPLPKRTASGPCLQDADRPKGGVQGADP